MIKILRKAQNANSKCKWIMTGKGKWTKCAVESAKVKLAKNNNNNGCADRSD